MLIIQYYYKIIIRDLKSFFSRLPVFIIKFDLEFFRRRKISL